MITRRQLLSAATFIKALPGYRYQFPQDHFSHPDFQTEWWYYTGNLSTRDQRVFGFELTFFRQALQPTIERRSIWSTRDAYMAHLALTDVQGKQFLHAERLNRPGPGLAGVDSSAERIWNGNWQVNLTPTVHRLSAVDERFALRLDMRPAKPPVTHGEQGVSQKGPLPGQASHYISFPRLSVAGEVSLQGQRHRVDGTAWMDHEYFSSELDNALAGWDWFSIQLENNTELMLYRLRLKNGTSSPFSAGSFIDAQGQTRHLKQTDFALTPGRRWKDYPIEWRIDIPSLNLQLKAIPRLDEQELSSRNQLTPSYWEGAMRFEGNQNGQPQRGHGYLEMTGYDRQIRLTRREATVK
jgi:predicted secreted hydrolase